MVSIYIIHNSVVFEPILLETATVTWVRAGQPGKLTFKCQFALTTEPSLGDPVKVLINGESFFYGFIFDIVPDGVALSITAYDQLRYLKNKDSYSFTSSTASLIVKTIAEDFGLIYGDIEDTECLIPDRVEENTELLDMIQNALDATLNKADEIYVLFDACGKLTLKNIENM